MKTDFITNTQETETLITHSTFVSHLAAETSESEGEGEEETAVGPNYASMKQEVEKIRQPNDFAELKNFYGME